MRTTVELPDSLLQRAKRAALEQKTTLRDLITRGLESVLRGEKGGEGKRMEAPPVRLSRDSPLRRLGPEELAALEAETEAEEIDEVHYRR